MLCWRLQWKLDVNAIENNNKSCWGGMDGSSKTNVRPRWCIRSNCERMGMARLFAVEDKGSQIGTDAPLDRQYAQRWE